MADALCAPAKPDRLLFDARLRPHRSLSRRGFRVLMALVAAVSATAGLGFYLAGAWPVIGFLGLDVALIYLAFRLSYGHARAYERLALTPGQLTVERVDHRGGRRAWTFQPYWLQVLIDDPPGRSSPLVLRSHGQDLKIGAYLSPSERRELAEALRTALHDLRCRPAREWQTQEKD